MSAMGENVKALKAVYVALGGDADDFDGITLLPDAINAIATQLGKGGGQLPEKAQIF